YDRSALAQDGRCLIADGYPQAVRCPFACPQCRGQLEWHGGCYRCHGIGLGAPGVPWFQGDRYDLFDDTGRPIGDGQHWILVERGPRQACSPEENREAVIILHRVLARLELERPLPIGRGPVTVTAAGAGIAAGRPQGGPEPAEEAVRRATVRTDPDVPF
ncbi:MAG: hypothetical protein AAB368_07510, partial [bacterium]